MYHRDDGRYDYKRRDQEGGREDGYKSARRNRWDDKGSDSVNSQHWRSDRRREEESSKPGWENKGRDQHEGSSSSSTSYSRSSRERRSRSRSRSPFRRSFRDCANPTKDEYASKSEACNIEPLKTTDNQYGSSRKTSSWSDSSSDEEDRSGKSNRVTGSLEGKKSSQFHFEDDRTPSTVTQNKPYTSEIESGASSGISLKLGGSSTKPMPLPKVINVSMPVKSAKVAAIFNTDDDDEPEEMPAECKMRMKNVGRETKTSEGPNSFGKTKIGFCNLSHLAEKQLENKPSANKKP